MNMPLTSNRGFTLIEMLITLAIVGVLVMVAVPSYRGMVAKSRTAESQSLLGALYIAEVALHSEFGTYGNNTAELGLGPLVPTFYSVGFPNGSCGAASAIFPATAPNSLFNNRKPNYFLALYQPVLAAANRTPTACQDVSGTPITNTVFLASATGCISATCIPATIGTLDTWTINQTRTIIRVQEQQ